MFCVMYQGSPRKRSSMKFNVDCLSARLACIRLAKDERNFLFLRGFWIRVQHVLVHAGRLVVQGYTLFANRYRQQQASMQISERSKWVSSNLVYGFVCSEVG
jgi:hypothetical protein